MSKSKLTQIFLIIVGIISVILGTVGVFLPLLPTTPFLLLAAASFIRSSDRLYQWLMHHRWFGTYIRNYREYKAIPPKSKIIVITMLWITLGYSILFVIEMLFMRIILSVIGISVTIHVLRMNTLTPEISNNLEES